MLAPNPNTGDNASIAIVQARYMSFNDDAYPNNEFVKLVLDPRFASSMSIDLGGYKIRNDAGDEWTFPTGTRVTSAQPVLVYTGDGTDVGGRVFWKRTSGAWRNDGDCARLVTPSGRVMYRLSWGDSTCSSTTASAMVATRGEACAVGPELAGK